MELLSAKMWEAVGGAGFGEGWGALAMLSLRFLGGAQGSLHTRLCQQSTWWGWGFPRKESVPCFVDDQEHASCHSAWKKQPVEKHPPLASPPHHLFCALGHLVGGDFEVKSLRQEKAEKMPFL